MSGSLPAGVPLPKEVVEDLVVASKHSVLSSTETLPNINGCFSMPRTLVQSLVVFFFALCCLGKIPGGAPFSQLHKSGNGSRVDRP